MTPLFLGWLAAAAIGAAMPAFAQTPAAGREPLQLAALQQAAREADARTRELDLLAQQTELLLHNIDAEQRPSVNVLGQSQYQSDVPKSPITAPDGSPLFGAPKFTYDASLRVDQRLWDHSTRPQ